MLAQERVHHRVTISFKTKGLNGRKLGGGKKGEGWKKAICWMKENHLGIDMLWCYFYYKHFNQTFLCKTIFFYASFVFFLANDYNNKNVQIIYELENLLNFFIFKKESFYYIF